MVGAQGRTVGVEHIPELAEFSIKNIDKSAAAPLLKEGSLSIHVAGMLLYVFELIVAIFTMQWHIHCLMCIVFS